MNSKYNDETKAAAVARVEAGESRGSVARSVGTTTANVSRWIDQAELAFLRTENTILRSKLAKALAAGLVVLALVFTTACGDDPTVEEECPILVGMTGEYAYDVACSEGYEVVEDEDMATTCGPRGGWVGENWECEGTIITAYVGGKEKTREVCDCRALEGE